MELLSIKAIFGR